MISSRLIEFWCLGSLRLWGGSRWVGVSGDICGHVGCPYIHAHACACTHTCVYMYRNCKWPLTWRHPCLSCLTYMLVCACMHVCMCVHGAWCPLHIPTPTQSTHLATPKGGPPESVKNSITLVLIKIIQFCLKI